jgi:diguanylate cyclase (GGDEF)-like protein
MPNQRQFVRLKTRQEARVRFADDQVVACEIRDFCPTGFYLRLLDQGGASVGPTLAQSAVRVEFGGVEAMPETYSVTGRVAHYAEAGLGIFTEAMPDPAFQALLEHRASLYRSAGGDRLQDLDPIDARTVRIQCLSLYRPYLARAMADFFSLARERGAEEYHASASLGEQSAYLSGLAELRQHQAEIQERFVKAALAKVEQVAAAAGPKAPAQGATELSLVEEDEFEDWLHLAAVINKLEVGLQRQVGKFERLYSLLTLRSEEQDYDAAFYHGSLGQTSPFSPDALCRSFQAGLEGRTLSNAQRSLFYRDFGQAIALSGAAFYESLSKVAAVVERRLGGAGLRRRVGETVPSGPGPVPGALPSGVPFTPEAASAETMGYSLDRTLAALNEFTGGASAHPAGGQAVPMAGGGTGYTGVVALENSLVRTTGVLQQVVSQLAQRLPHYQAPFALTPAETRQDLPAATTNEVLLALDGLVQAREAARPSAWQPSLSEQLRLRLSQAGGAAVRIAPQQQQLLDSLAGLFDRAMQEYAPASELEALVKRFEATFFKLALKDPDFLVSDSHPARQVINILDQFAIAADDNGKFFDPNMPKVLAALIDNIIARADQEPEIYDKAVQTLDKMLQPLQRVRKQRINRLQETSEGKNRILQSRIRVLTELEARVGGRDVPRLLLRLLDGGWRHYLSLLELRQGLQGLEWEEGIGAVDRLLEWLQPGFAPGDDYPAQLAVLMRQVRRQMATVCVEPGRLDCMLNELDSLLQSRLQSPQAEVERVHLEPGRMLRGYEDEAVDLPEDSKLRAQLVLGSWWDIAGESSRAAPMQLIWLSQPPGSCAFANRSATKKVELSLAELALRQEAGRAGLATDKELPLLERSESALIDVVYKHLARQASHDPVTDLINQKSLLQQLALMAAMPSCEGQSHTLCVLQFDQLRVIGHKYGIEAREDLLRHLALEVQQRLRPDDLLAALGEDSFAAYLPACTAEDVRGIITGVLDWLKTYRFHRDIDTFSIGASVGMLEFSPGVLSADDVLRRASAACVQASSIGRNQIRLYTPEDASLKGEEFLIEWAGRIDKILDANGLYLRCQLISPVNGDAGLQPYYEILLGIRDPEGVEMGPQPFIQAAERWNRVHDIDRWVVGSVLAWIRANPEVFAAIGGFSVNLSSLSLSNEELLAFLHQELARRDFPMEKLAFEITETGTIGSYAAAQEFIQQIRQYGCKFCIDDFGSGYASYGHLKNLQTDTLKIDGIFIKDMLQSPADYAMVKSMKEIGHSLGMHVVAEFVATPEILAAVREIGVDYAQGYALHKPMPIDGLAAAVTAAAATE